MNITCIHVHNNVWNHLTPDSRVSAGSCNNRVTLTRSRLKQLIQTGEPSLPSEVAIIAPARVFLHVKNKTPFDNKVPQVFRQKESVIREWGISKMKGALSAILPSINIGSQYKRQLNRFTGKEISTKCSITNCLRQGDNENKVNPNLWYHTGVFGIDIDLGKQGNTSDPDEMRKQFEEGVKKIGGCILAYNSPSGGIKALFQVREFPKEDITFAQLSQLHDVYYLHICTKLREATGLVPDMACRDICRIQYICQSDWVFSFEGAGFNYSSTEAENLAKYELKEESIRKRSLHIECIPAVNEAPLPDYVIDPFVSWLERNEISDSIIDGVKNLSFMEGNSAGYKGFCPCCASKRTTEANPTDLMCVIGKENDLYSVYFTCFHGTCRNGDVVSMNNYWTRFLAEWETDMDVEAEVVRRGLYVNNLPNTIPQSNVNGTVSNDACPPIMVNTVTGAGGFPLMDEKKGVPMNKLSNIKWFVQQVLGGEIIYDKMSHTASFIYKKEGGYILSDGRAYTGHVVTDTFMNNLITMLDEAGLKVNTTSVVTVLDDMGSANSCSTFLEWVEEGFNKWDGVDRLSQLYDTIVIDKEWSLGTDQMTTREFVNESIKKWLMGIYIKACQSFLEQPVLDTNSKEYYYNAMPVFVGNQGKGKTRWVRQLFGSKFQQWCGSIINFNPDNKDHLGVAVGKAVLFLDEFDMSCKQVGDNNSLKAFITLDHCCLRLPYRRNAKMYVIPASYIGATNNDRFISDPTGSRRFLVMRIEKLLVEESNGASLHSIDVQQLWGQIRHMVSSDPTMACDWGQLEQVSSCNNDKNFIVERDYNYLVEDLVWIPRNLKTPRRESMRKLVDKSFTTVANIIKYVGLARGINIHNPTRQDSASFKNALLLHLQQTYPKLKREDLSPTNSHTRIPVMLKSEYETAMNREV